MRGMLPGISSLDCLWCDLGIDPAAGRLPDLPRHGLRRSSASRPDTAATLILLQINVIGQAAHLEQPDWSRLPVLVDYLAAFYPADHEVIGYEASPYPIAQPIVERAPLAELAEREPQAGDDARRAACGRRRWPIRRWRGG